MVLGHRESCLCCHCYILYMCEHPSLYSTSGACSTHCAMFIEQWYTYIWCGRSGLVNHRDKRQITHPAGGLWTLLPSISSQPSRSPSMTTSFSFGSKVIMDGTCYNVINMHCTWSFHLKSNNRHGNWTSATGTTALEADSPGWHFSFVTILVDARTSV